MHPLGHPLLQVADVSVTLEGETLIEHISFDVHQGEIVTILGPNGAGKTVLLRTLLGALPHHGTIVWQKNLSIGYVPQRLPYVKEMPLSVRDFFTLKRPPPVDTGSLLEDVGLAVDIDNKRMGDLSSGQFQRILIAWALAAEPQVLLFDEPTTGIDVTGEETVYGLLSRIHAERNLTMLLITHDLAVVHKLSSTVLCLNRRLVCQGSPIDVLTPSRLHELYGTEVAWYRHRHDHD